MNINMNINITKKPLHTNIGGSLLRIVFAGVVAGLSLSGLTARADSLWTGAAQDNNWNNPANWKGGTPWTDSGTITVANDDSVGIQGVFTSTP
ncbi:MAG: hypothetical protein LBK99_20025 [Opitutaceae bacterium]|jgi:hypothetical protein|nr:hypothetical protein [Opitutaceae bacterium]